jgi:exopolyphosphatase/guanosine-5'-triphosphate,3'-diphosphate pyrophosphatase
MSRHAVFDIGSHTNALLVCEGDLALCDLRQVTDLKKGARPDGSLCSEAMARSLDSLFQLWARADALSVPLLNRRVLATAALRKAPNRGAYLQAAQERGIAVQVIAGEEEAALSYAANRALAGNGLYIDLGGGSTELCWPEGRMSLEMGGWHLPESLDAMLQGLNLPPFPGIWAAGGTLCTLAAQKLGLEKFDPQLVQATKLSIEDLKAASSETQPPEQNAARIALALLQRIGLDHLRVTVLGLRHGAMKALTEA